MMERFFNTAGPNIPEDHYHIPSLERVDWEEIQRLIAQKRYFLLHAPRQTGKTSVLLDDGSVECAGAPTRSMSTSKQHKRFATTRTKACASSAKPLPPVLAFTKWSRA